MHKLNSYFKCEFSHRCCHIHLIPISIKEDLKILGLKEYTRLIEWELDDALYKINSQMKYHPFARGVFAVSPLLKSKNAQKIFKSRGFEVKNTTRQYFLNMFDNKTTYEAWINRKDLKRRVQ